MVIKEEHKYMQQCQICKKQFKRITNTHLALHNLKIEEYLKKFPEEKIRIGIEFEKGKKSWNKGLVFVKYNYYTIPAYYEYIYKKIRERDNNKCQKCGATENLIVHHKIPIPRGKNIPKNLITLCKRCHSKLHKKKMPFYKFVATRKFSFEAGHFLKNYSGLCQNQHGHNYEIEVRVGADELDEKGMVLDFSELKKIVSDVIDSIDHQNLNDIFKFNPTAENIAWYIYYSLRYNIEGLLSITVYETPNCCITYTQYEK